MPAKRSVTGDLSALEQRRLDNIARNELFLSSLGLDEVKVEQEKVNRKASQKGIPVSVAHLLACVILFRYYNRRFQEEGCVGTHETKWKSYD